MWPLKPQQRGISRRALFAGLSLPLAAQLNRRSGPLPPGGRRFLDPATEFEVVRLTDPGFESRLAAGTARCLPRKENLLLFSSDAGGTPQLYRTDLKTAETRQIGQASSLVQGQFSLGPQDRTVGYFDAGSLKLAQLGNGKDSEVTRVREGWQAEGPPIWSEDGLALFFVESRGGRYEIRSGAGKGPVSTIADSKCAITELLPNPRRTTLAWLQDDGTLWAGTYQGQQRRQVETPSGKVLQAHWSPDGRSLLYLLAPAETGQLNSIQEQELDSRADKLVSRTSQFAAFHRNANATVFVGASQNKASPSILLLLRQTRREFTLCEHRSSRPERTGVVFSPDSQQIFFESDREGKPAIYMMNIEKLVEKTDS